MFPIRINKFLALSGYCSRREADRLIDEGKVLINTRKATLGTKVNQFDEVTVGQKQIIIEEEAGRWFAFNKPVGVIASIDEKTKDNLLDTVNLDVKFYPVGGLDVASSGLLILAPDGPTAQKLLKVLKPLEKEYLVNLHTEVTPQHIKDIQEGMVLKQGGTDKPKARTVSEKKMLITVHQAHDNELAELLEGLELEIQKITRLSQGPISLGNIKVGEVRELNKDDVAKIKKLLV